MDPPQFSPRTSANRDQLCQFCFEVASHEAVGAEQCGVWIDSSPASWEARRRPEKSEIFIVEGERAAGLESRRGGAGVRARSIV